MTHGDCLSMRMHKVRNLHWHDRLTQRSPAKFLFIEQHYRENITRHHRHRRHLLLSPMTLPEKRALPWKDIS